MTRQTHILLHTAYIILLCATRMGSHQAYAQETPPILTFEPSAYQAGNQNWMADQCENGTLVFANDGGLLTYNGSQWELFALPSRTSIRSVKAVGDRIYTGSNMDVGYWERNKYGKYQYTSLMLQSTVKIKDDEQFWGIVAQNKQIYFQSPESILTYNPQTNTLEKISSHTLIKKIFKVDNEIFYHVPQEGLYQIQSKKVSVFSTDPVFLTNNIIGISIDESGMTVLTETKGFFRYSKEWFVSWETEVDQLLEDQTVFSSLRLSSGHYAIGTISMGFILLNKQGRLIHHIKKTSGLSNNTVLSIKEDRDQNVWLGLDRGINCLNLSSPFQEFIDYQGSIGTVYTSITHRGYLYVGSNQGLYYKKIDDVNNANFELINKTKGQVWSLMKYDDRIFCGHNRGVFVIQTPSRVQHIETSFGTWKLSAVPNHSATLLCGSYKGFYTIEKKNNVWQFKEVIQGSERSTQHFIFDNNDLYLMHPFRGLFKIELSSDVSKIHSETHIPTPPSLGSANFVSFEGRTFYGSQNNLFQFNPGSLSFTLMKDWIDLPPDEGHYITKLISDNTNHTLWVFTHRTIHYILYSPDTQSYSTHQIPITEKMIKTVSGFENVYGIKSHLFYIGLTDGYIVLDTKKSMYEELNFGVGISSVMSRGLETGWNQVEIRSNQDFDYQTNNITLSANVPRFDKFSSVNRYSFTLNGQGSYTTEPTITYQNLSHGSYTLEVKAYMGEKVSVNTTTYNFEISPPWYQSYFAKYGYALAVVILLWAVNTIYKVYYSRQKNKLIRENNQKVEFMSMRTQQEMTELKNQQLVSEVETRSKELAANTMRIVRKNEFLIKIKDSLEKFNPLTAQKLIAEINKELEDTETWNFFKKAFDTVDKEFLTKIKAKHPKLTPQDLKLCAYLRLNLSSKEIAPLLNVSSRSMEVKRYRLRKKLNLPSKTNLIDYIISI